MSESQSVTMAGKNSKPRPTIADTTQEPLHYWMNQFIKCYNGYFCDEGNASKDNAYWHIDYLAYQKAADEVVRAAVEEERASVAVPLYHIAFIATRKMWLLTRPCKVANLNSWA